MGGSCVICLHSLKENFPEILSSFFPLRRILKKNVPSVRCLQKNCRSLHSHTLVGLGERVLEYLVKSFLICSWDNGIKLCEQLCSVHPSDVRYMEI